MNNRVANFLSTQKNEKKSKLLKTAELKSSGEVVNEVIAKIDLESAEKSGIKKSVPSKKIHPKSLFDQDNDTSTQAVEEKESTPQQQVGHQDPHETRWVAIAEAPLSQSNASTFASAGAMEDGGEDEDRPERAVPLEWWHFLNATTAAQLGVGAIALAGIGALSQQGDSSKPPLDLTITPQSKASDATPTISGIGTPGGKITAVTPTGETLTATVQSDGTWTVTPTKPLPDGLQIINVTETDNSGQTTTKTTSVTIDATPPAAPTSALASTSDSGAPGDSITNDTTPTINGTAEPGAKITVVSPTGETMTTTVDASGHWAVTPTTALPSSATPQTFSITATDTAGNTSAPASLPLTIDATPPAAPTSALASTSDSGAPGDSITNDTTPTINGTAEPGAKITVVSPTGETMTTTVDASGHWAVTPTTALPSSATPQTFSITATDTAGNTSAPASLPLTIDATPPAAPTSALASTSDSGAPGDSITNDTTPTINGTAEPGAKITVVSPTGETMTTTVDASGHWAVTPTTALPSSATPQTFSITATDTAGNTSAPASLPLTIDATPPAAPTSALASTSDSGAPGDSITNDTKPTINGTAEPGAKITVVSPTGETMTTTVASNGTWSVTPTTALPSSTTPQNFSIMATDVAGNTSATATLPLTIDNTPPALPTSALASTSDSGTPGDSITSNTKPTINGTAEPGAKITVVSPTGETMTTTVDASGHWAVTPTTALPSSATPQTFSITATDAAGNTSAPAALPLTIDNTPPAAPVAKLDPTSDSGTLGDSITNDTTPTISGTGSPGDKITVVSPTGETMTTTVSPTGTWSVTPLTVLTPGSTPQTFSVTEADAAGNTSTVAVPVTISTPPAPPTSALALASDSGAPGDSITSNTKPTINGTAEPGAKITVVSPTGETMTTTVASNGTWSVTPTTALPSSTTPQNFSIMATDVAGNTSATATLPLTIDNTPPALPTSALASTSDSGTPGDSITSNTKPTINGTAEPGAKITVVSPTGETMTTTVASNGTWSVTPTTALPSSTTPQNFSIMATDVAGNTSATATLPLTIDNTPPALPTSALASTSDSGTPGDSITSNTKPTINGTAEPGAKITVVSPTGETMTTTVASNGTWSVTPTTALPSSTTPQNFSIMATDVAGNTSATATLPLTIDNTPPALPTSALASTSDSGTPGDSITSNTKPTINGTAEPGAKITVVSPTGETMTTTVASNGTWSVTPTTALPSSTTPQNFSIMATDVAGNTSATATLPLTIDNTPPALPTSALASTSDSGTPGDSITSNTKPTINGTAEPGAKITVVSPTGETMTTTVASNGTWSVTPTTALPSSTTPQNFSIMATDVAGNTSATATLPLTIDNTPPALPTSALASTSDSGTPGDSITSNTKPTINGTAEPGAKITVVSPTGETMTTTVASNGTWSVTPTTALPSSTTPQNFSIMATDVAGNTSATATLPLTIDNTPPALPTSALASTSDSGTPGDSITSNTKPTINGTAEPGAKITVVSPTGETMTTTVASNGTWSVTPTTALPSSTTPQNFSIMATDVAGNTSATATLPLTIDNTPPALPTSALASTSDSGTPGDSITSNTKPTINGTAEPGAKITVVSPTGETMTTTVASNGTWSVTPTTALPSSTTPQNFSIMATDVAGNTSATATLPLTIDNTPPALPTSALASTSDSGTPGDSITSNTKPTINGTAEPGAKITVVSPTGETMTTTVASNGTWSVTPTTALPSSTTPQNFSIMATDVAGNTSATATLPLTIDNTPPALPTSALASTSDSGTPGDSITSNTKPTINGTAEPGAKITVVSPTGETMTTTVASNGTWSVTPTTALPSSTTPQNFSIMATDVAGNTSATATLPLTIDNTPPALPTSALASTSDSGTPGDSITSNTKPTINGTAEPGAKITVVSPTGETMTTTVASNGTWSVTPTTALPSSTTPQNFSIMATDVAGNTSATATLPLTIDNTPPALPTSALASTSDSGTPGDSITSNTKPTINGTAEPGAKITVVSPTGETMTTTVASNGTWSVTPTTALPSSTTPQNFSIMATDVAGNTSATATLPLTIDNTPPALPTSALASTSDSGTLGDSITNDTKPTINGTAEPGAKITVVSPTGETMTTTVASNGTWSVTPTTALPSSTTPQNFSIMATDVAGNTSATATLPLTIDNTPPALPTSALASTSDSGTPGDSITSNTKPTINGTAEPGAKITVVSPTGETMTTTVASNGTWSVTPTTALPSSTTPQNFSIMATDVAGNTSATATLPLTIDNTPPALPTSALASTSDSGTPGDSITSNTKPTINGTAEPGAKITVVSPTGETMTTTVASNGTWSVTPTTALPSSTTPQNFSIMATDVAGNTSATATLPLTIDNTPPALPTSALASTSDSGTPGDSITSNTKPTINGTAEPGAKITVVSPTGETMTTTVASNGTWSVTPTTALPSSTTPQNFSIMATDVAGNTSATATLPLTIDNTPPSVLTAGIAPASDTGTLGDSTTAINKPALTGLGDPGAKMTVVSPTGETMTTTVDASGHWTVTPTTALSLGLNTLSVIESDAAGNTQTASLPVTIDTSTSAITVTITTDASNNGVINQVEWAAAATPLTVAIRVDLTTPSKVLVGDSLVVTDNFGHSTTISITSTDITNGYVTLTMPKPNEDQTITVTATLSNPHGGSSSGSDFALIDITPPGTPTVEILADSNNDGYINSAELAAAGGSTSSVRVRFPTAAASDNSYKAAAANDVITIYAADGTTLLGTHTLTAGEATSGQYDFTGIAVPANGGTLTVLAQLKDGVGGNFDPGWSSIPSNPGKDIAVVDTSAAAPPTLALASDTGASSTDNITKVGTINVGSIEAGATWQYSTDGGTTWTTGGGTSFALPVGTYAAGAVQVRQTDTAGNVSTPTSSAAAITVDQSIALPTVGTSDPEVNGKINAAGTAEAGSTVTITWPDSTTSTVLANASGNWSLESPTMQASGNVSVSAVDLAGNTSASVSAPFVLPKPTETPTIITYTDNVGTSTGDFGSGVVTDDTTPVLNGTLSAALASGEVVKVYDGATLLGNATVTGTTWTYAPSALALGSTHNYTAVVVNGLNQSGTTSNSFSVVVNTPPTVSAPVTAATTENVMTPTAINLLAHASDADSDPLTVSNVTYTVNGVATASSGAALPTGYTLSGSTLTVDPNNSAFDAIAKNATQTVVATYTISDGRGGSVTQTATTVVTGINDAPVLTGTTMTGATTVFPTAGPTQGAGAAMSSLMPLATDVDTGSSVKGYAVTSAAANGTDHWEYYNGSAWMPLTTASTSAAIFLTPSTLVRWNGSIDDHMALTARVVDDTSGAALGNTIDVTTTGGITPYSATSATLSAITTPVITTFTDNVGTTTGAIANNGSSDDTTPLIAGTLLTPAVAGQVVEVYRDGVLIGTAATTVGSKAWSYQDTGLVVGHTYAYTADTLDAGGSKSVLSNTWTESIIAIQLAPATPSVGAAPFNYLVNIGGGIGDYNNDGFADISFSDDYTGNNEARIWTGSSAGTFSALISSGMSLPSVRDNPNWVGDLNADGKMDVAGSAANWIYFNNGAGAGTRVFNVAGGVNVGVGNFTGNGLFDMVAANGNPGTNTGALYTTNGTQTITMGPTISAFDTISGDTNTNRVAEFGPAGDFNGDGYSDFVTNYGVVFGSPTPTAVTLTAMTASQGVMFTNMTGTADVSASGLGDINGDGYADIGWADKATDTYRVIFGSSSTTAINVSTPGTHGFVITHPAYTTTNSLKESMVGIGDINGDGLQDFVFNVLDWADTNKGGTYVIFGKTDTSPVDLANVTTGAGGFKVTNPDSGAYQVEATGDINGDGVADFIFTNLSTNIGTIYTILGGATTGFTSTASGATAAGTAASDLIQGTTGADVVHGNGGTDVIYTGAGNDKIYINASNITALQTGYDATANRLARIDGGSGVDTLAIDGSSTTLDFTQINAAGQVDAVDASRVSSIERVDLTGSGAASNKLTLSLWDVMSMNTGFNTFHTGTATGVNDLVVTGSTTATVGAVVQRHQLMVDGDATDTVTVAGMANWTMASAGTVAYGGHTYAVYNTVGANQAQLLIDQAVHVNFIA